MEIPDAHYSDRVTATEASKGQQDTNYKYIDIKNRAVAESLTRLMHYHAWADSPVQRSLLQC